VRQAAASGTTWSMSRSPALVICLPSYGLTHLPLVARQEASLRTSLPSRSMTTSRVSHPSPCVIQCLKRSRVAGWLAWTFKLASPFTPPTNWRDYGQFHAGVGSPSFAFQAHSDGSFWIEQRGGTYVNGSGNYKTMELTPSVAPDVEHTVVVFRHWSTTTSGITKVWYDRDPSQAPNVSLSGPTLEIGYESAPYMKYGMYGQSNVADNTVYVSNIRWATTAAGL